MTMSETTIEEYTKKMRNRYARMTERKARGALLDEYVEMTGWERKHANKVLPLPVFGTSEKKAYRFLRVFHVAVMRLWSAHDGLCVSVP
jgi:hypothetical protein